MTVTRRGALGAMGAGALASGLLSRELQAAEVSGWTEEVDVICVGSGAAGCAAAIAAVDQGATAVVLEKMPVVGGTTAKSGGAVWVPNNSLLRRAGLQDNRDDCLRYLARYSYPHFYNADSPNLGVPELQFKLLEAFYDNGAVAIDRLMELGAAHFHLFTMRFIDRMSPDYADHLPENKTPRGRSLEALDPADAAPKGGAKSFDASAALGPGQILVDQMSGWLRKRKVQIATNHQVTAIIKDKDAVVGVEVQAPGNRVMRLRAKRGVVFASGGFAHNDDYMARYLPEIAASCAKPSSTGDFISMATRAGALMGALDTAWLKQVLVEEVIESRVIGLGLFLVPGDSMVIVNKCGRRVVNEKRSYNDRTKAHFPYDPTQDEYPNQYLFLICDERAMSAFAGSYPYPTDKREVSYLIEGRSWSELAANVAKRLGELKPYIGEVRLSVDFAAHLQQTIERFNTFARDGKDLDFGRGNQAYDRDYHDFSSTPRPDSKYPKNTMLNNTMYPFASTGPYYCIIIAAGALDTSGGPVINENAQVLDAGMEPIPGLYGAGNCIASPTGSAYYGAGGTLGPALTFGFMAGKNAATRALL